MEKTDLIAKFEHFLQRLAVGVDHNGVSISVYDFQVHLSDKGIKWHKGFKVMEGQQSLNVNLNLNLLV